MKKNKNETSLRCQVAVVGSGPGGAISAALMAEAGRDVIAVEEGPFMTQGQSPPFSLQEMRDKYRDGGITVAMGRNKVAYVEGKCVGGGSEINSGLYHRTPNYVLERWKKDFQVENLSEKDLSPFFKTVEDDLQISYYPGTPPKASLKLHDGALRLGWESKEIPRWYRYEQPPSQSGGPIQHRNSMTATYIPRFIKAGGNLLPDTKAMSLIRSKNHWVVRCVSKKDGPKEIVADHVFICGGAIQTSKLLLRSGIRRNIGNNLQMHPTVKVVAKFDDTVNSEAMGVPVHQVKQFAPDFSFGCSISTPPYLALGLINQPEAIPSLDQDWHQMAIYYCMISSSQSGKIRLLPGCDSPLVLSSITNEDLIRLSEGLSKLCLALF